MLIAFTNYDADGRFGGELIDPVPVGWIDDVMVIDHPASPYSARGVDDPPPGVPVSVAEPPHYSRRVRG